MCLQQTWALLLCLPWVGEAVLSVNAVGCALPWASISGGCWELPSRVQEQKLDEMAELKTCAVSVLCLLCIWSSLRAWRGNRWDLLTGFCLVTGLQQGFEDRYFSEMCVLQDIQPSALLSSPPVVKVLWCSSRGGCIPLNMAIPLHLCEDYTIFCLLLTVGSVCSRDGMIAHFWREKGQKRSPVCRNERSVPLSTRGWATDHRLYF